MAHPPVRRTGFLPIPFHVLDTALNLTDGHHVVRADVTVDPPQILLVIEGPNLPEAVPGAQSEVLYVGLAKAGETDPDASVLSAFTASQVQQMETTNGAGS